MSALFNTNKNSETKKTSQPMSKKNKTILISVLSVVALLVIAAVVVLVVLLLDKGADKGDNYKMPSRKMQYEYYIDHEDLAGFYLSDAFREEVPLDAFTKTTVVSGDNVKLSDDLLLKVEDGVEIDTEATYHFSYKNQVVAVVNVKVIDADGYITTAEELLALSGDKTYIVKNAINLSGKSGNISRFIGKIHFNHNIVDGFDASNGGLFKELDGAMVTGLDMVSVGGYLQYSSYGNVGVIADYINNTQIRYSSVKGSLNVTSTAASSDAVYVGGMVGYSNAAKRKNYLTEKAQFVQLVSYLDLTVNGSGDLKVGGLIGGVRNGALWQSYSYGKINVNVSESVVSRLGNLYVGGLVGALSKQYDTVNTAYNLDESDQLYSMSDITVNVNGGGEHNSISVGGVFGFLKNHSLVNSSYSGKMNVNLTRTHLKLGGIIGSTDNETSLKMNVRGVEVSGELKIYSLASVYAGGLMGESVGTGYSHVVASVKPVINTDKSKVQGTQIAIESVASVK